MSKKGKCSVDYFRKRERQEVRKILLKVKKRIASVQDYSNANQDHTSIKRQEWG